MTQKQVEKMNMVTSLTAHIANPTPGSPLNVSTLYLDPAETARAAKPGYPTPTPLETSARVSTPLPPVHGRVAAA